MDSGSVGSVADQAAVSVLKKSQDIEKTKGANMVRLIEGGSVPASAELASPGERGSLVHVIA